MRYRAFGIPRKLTLGAYPAVDLATARRRAQEALGDVAGGNDPAGQKKAARETARAERKADVDRVERVAEFFVERYVKRSGKVGPGWGEEVERLFKIEILPRIGAKRIGDVTKRDINDILDAIVDRGSRSPRIATFAVLRKFFSWACDDRDSSRCRHARASTAPAAETSRDRVLERRRNPSGMARVRRNRLARSGRSASCCF